MAAPKNPRPELSKAIFFVIMRDYEKWRADRAMWKEWLRTRFSDKQLWQLAPEPRFTVGGKWQRLMGGFTLVQ